MTNSRNRGQEDGSSDNLEALEALDPLATSTCDELLQAMSKTAFGGRRLGEAAEVLTEMVSDPECSVVATFSGAMTVAKMTAIIVRMIDLGMIQCVVSTGALMSHGLCEGMGMKHYKVPPRMTDLEMFKKGYDRVYDTLELEANLNETERFVLEQLQRLEEGSILSSERICHMLGEGLSEGDFGPSILGSAYEKKVPIYIPAFTDSEMGLDVMVWRLQRAAKQHPDRAVEEIFSNVNTPVFNPFFDLQSYARFCLGQKKLGIFTIGGGVPRNWAQQVAPLYDLLALRTGVKIDLPRFRYGVRICPEPVHWGGLSGCTYAEGVSWGKFVPVSEGGRFAEVYADATVAWPLLIRGVMERLGKLR